MLSRARFALLSVALIAACVPQVPDEVNQSSAALVMDAGTDANPSLPSDGGDGGFKLPPPWPSPLSGRIRQQVWTESGKVAGFAGFYDELLKIPCEPTLTWSKKIRCLPVLPVSGKPWHYTDAICTKAVVIFNADLQPCAGTYLRYEDPYSPNACNQGVKREWYEIKGYIPVPSVAYYKDLSGVCRSMTTSPKQAYAEVEEVPESTLAELIAK